MLAIPLLLVAGYLFKNFNPGGFAGGFLVNLALIQIFLILSIVPHELGHALSARALGWRVYQITIGAGKQLWKARWGNTLIDLRLIPLSGATFMVPNDMSLFRLKLFLSVLAGPSVNALMAVAVILAFEGSAFPLDLEPLSNTARLFVFSNGLVLLFNLWPRQASTGMGSLGTDGKLLIQLLSFRKSALDELRASRFAHEANLARERGDLAAATSSCEKGLALYPDNVALLNWSGITHLDAQRYDFAREVFLKLLQKAKPNSAVRLVLLNNIAYADALSGRTELLAEADAYSRDAHAMLPWLPAAMGTRGTVLVALGKYAEGIQLLEKSLADADSARNKSENACLLVLAYAKTGQEKQAANYYQLAKQLDGQCPLLDRAARWLSTGKADPERALQAGVSVS